MVQREEPGTRLENALALWYLPRMLNMRRYAPSGLAPILLTLLIIYAFIIAYAVPGANAAGALELHAVQAAAWTPAQAPVPSGDSQVVFDSMSCPAADWCTALATVSYLGGPGEVYIYNYIDGFWNKETTPGPITYTSSATQCSFCYVPISCPAIGYCVSLAGSPLEAVTETDGNWQAYRLKAPQNTTITSISCPAVGQCAAVGNYIAADGRMHGLAATETKGTWKVTQLNDPAIADPHQKVYLSQVACPPSGACAAYGQYTPKSQENPVPYFESQAESGAWTQSVPKLPVVNDLATSDVWLNSISCPAAGKCIAVGETGEGNGGVGLVYTENSRLWVSRQPPLPSNYNPGSNFPQVDLLSISCPQTAQCIAVGRYPIGYGETSATASLIMTDTSGRWNPAEAPQSPQATGPNESEYGLTAVSCAEVDSCAAVGYEDNSSSGAALLTDSGGTWSAIAAPLPSGESGYFVPRATLVSCPRTGACTVAGWYMNSAGLAEEDLLQQGHTHTVSDRYVALGDSVPYGHGLANPTLKKHDGLPPSQSPSASAWPSLVAKALRYHMAIRSRYCALSADQLTVSGAPMTAADAGKWPDCRSPHHAAVAPTELGAADIGNDPPTLVTIEAGADDINFGGCLKYALGLRKLLGGGVKCTSKGHVTGPIAAILANVASSLVNTIAAIDNEGHGLSKVLVVDYYEPIPSHQISCLITLCCATPWV